MLRWDVVSLAAHQFRWQLGLDRWRLSIGIFYLHNAGIAPSQSRVVPHRLFCSRARHVVAHRCADFLRALQLFLIMPTG